MADHNDFNAVNSIFSDIGVSAADVYDMFGFPGDDRAGEEKVVIALTFASVPEIRVLCGLRVDGGGPQASRGVFRQYPISPSCGLA
jgi:hypothetical protein